MPRTLHCRPEVDFKIIHYLIHNIVSRLAFLAYADPTRFGEPEQSETTPETDSEGSSLKMSFPSTYSQEPRLIDVLPCP